MNVIETMLKDMKEKYFNYRKNRSNSRRFRAFYSSSKEDKRGGLAKIIDYLLGRMFIFFAVFLIAYLKIGYIYASTVIAAVFLTIYHIFSINIRKEKLTHFKKEKRKAIANEKIYKEILNKTVDEMKEYLAEIFNKRGFDEIKCLDHSHNFIRLEALYHHNKVMILCYMYKNNFDVDLKDLKEFLCQLINSNTKRGIFITTSDFTQDCHSFLDQLNEKYTMVLVNKDKFLDVIEASDMFPSEEEIDEMIENKISKSKKSWEKYKLAVLNNKKIKGYLLLSVYLAIIAVYIPYTKYYMIIVSILLFLTLTTIFVYFKEKRQKQGEWKDIENLFRHL
ncbi:restriction endonuclease [Clostridium formicaceticum]|uniref:Restriction endonuclease n=1 Tax=Clostridium formicaceticum TaxID=1497 RepID=A0AAC9RLR0_9CLOT|nr:restriction endonuclease [Clostridium formicaceticum]AOY77443.1 hypothetical protein BJL90_17240 [Clostridium formicaceticum]ARE87999.1 Restriction endonuclease [Clostridium formicaceticum]